VVIELKYYSEQNRVFLFKYYWYDTTNRKIRADLHHGLVKIKTRAILCNVNDVFVFAKKCEQVYYIHTHSFRKHHSRADWLSIVKTKPRGHIQVVHYSNNELTMRDDVFQFEE
jgi:hypothetical protein